MKKIAVVFAILLAVAACSKKSEVGQQGPYLAKIDGTTITQDDYDREFQSLPDYAKQIFADPSGREKFLNEIINKELLYKDALNKGLDKTPEFSRKVDDFRKLTLVSAVFEKEIMATAKVTDQDVKDYYEKNKAEFMPVKEIKASHILVKSEEEAVKVLARLKNGEKFDAVAKAVSVDAASAKNGGDLGYFRKGQMVPEFERAASSLKVGEISSRPVKTQFGYHIIKVTDKKQGTVLGFEEVRDLISQKLSGERQKEAFEKYVAGLRNTIKVEINKDALAQLPRPQEKNEAQESPAKTEENREETKKEGPDKK
jgi:peptidyl-prolyl cis-trans isomerase C